MNKPAVEMVATDKLIPYARNAKKHDEAQVSLIAGSIRQFGFNNPILIAEDNGIVAGHGRVLAAMKLGLAEVPCIRLSHLDENQRRAYILADNRLAELGGGWDLDMLAAEMDALGEVEIDVGELGFDEAFLSLMDLTETESEVDAEAQIDKAEELRVKWGVETGQLWQLGEHRLVCGDCTDKAVVDRLMSSERADAVITDPPYNVSYSSRGSNTESWGKIENDEMSDEDFYLWLLKVGKSINYVLKNGAAIYLCHGDTDRKSIPFIDIFRDIGWKRSSTIIWAKQAASMGWQDYRSQHECLSYGWKEGSEHFFVNDRTQTTVWQIDRDASSKYLHPTQKPVELFEKAINNSSKAGDLVFEPFSGSGTTIIACERLGRKCRAIEIHPPYVAVALQRWADATGKTPVLI
jgi:DNA modification methylase